MDQDTRILDKLDSMSSQLSEIKVAMIRIETLEGRVKELEVNVKSMTKKINYAAGAIAAVLAFVSIVKEFIMKGAGV